MQMQLCTISGFAREHFFFLGECLLELKPFVGLTKCAEFMHMYDIGSILD